MDSPERDPLRPSPSPAGRGEGAGAPSAGRSNSGREGGPPAGARPPAHALRVCYQGEPGAFSEEAALTWFGEAAQLEAAATFRDVAEAVVDGEADAAVLPVENTLAGGVARAYDSLGSVALEVVGELVRPIEMCLLALPGTSLGEVRRAASHPVALAQCAEFLARHPSIEGVLAHDTAGAARDVAERGDPSAAAIAGRRAAERYGLDILKAGIQDRPDNRTRFFVVVREGAEVPGAAATPPEGGGRWKMALALETEHRPGALADVLVRIAARGADLTHLECLPGEDPWTYRFFLDVASPEREVLEGALEAVEGTTRRLRRLGLFPAVAA